MATFASRTRRVLNTISFFLFEDGWRFLIPCFLIYLAAWGLNLPLSKITPVCSAINLAEVTLFFYFIAVQARKKPFTDVLFWTALALLLILPGAYLEYPSDPWEHVRRIFLWHDALTVKGADIHSELSSKFVSFFGWTLLWWTKVLHRRAALAVYGGLWELAWVYQFYLFVRRLGFEKRWGYLQAVGMVCLFGTNLFGIRYYALSPTPIAQIAYLQSLILLMDWIDGKKLRWFSLVLLLLLIRFDHRQELFLFGVGAAALAVAWLWEHRRMLAARCCLIGLFATYAVFLLSGLWLRHHYAAYAAASNGYLSRLFTLRLWSPGTTHFQTFAIPGLLALALLPKLMRMPRLAAFTAAPFLVCLCPPAMALLPKLHIELSASYRIFYLLPLSTGLIGGLRFLLEDSKRPALRNSALGIVSAIVIVLGLLPKFPFRGRLFFQLYQAPRARTLAAVDTAAAWLSENRTYSHGCKIVSDNATMVAVASLLGRPEGEWRREPGAFGRRLVDKDRFRDVMDDFNICAFLVAEPQSLPPSVRSPIAIRSSHWGLLDGDWRWLSPPEFASAAKVLLDWGWSRTFVPPFYSLYEPPTEVGWTLLDVNREGAQQADAHLLQFPGGETMLVDAGFHGDRIVYYLKNARIEKLDKVIVSHPHKDHYGGLTALLDAGIQIRELFVNVPGRSVCDAERPWGCDYTHLLKTLSRIKRSGTVIRPLEPGQILFQRGTVQLKVLYAFDGVHTPVGRTDINDTSAVLLLSVDGHRALFTGDLNNAIGGYLAAHRKDLRAEILKVPHHGTESTVPDAFFDAVSPTLALIPSPAALWTSPRSQRIRDYFERHHIRTLVSGAETQISVLFHRGKVFVYTDKRGLPIWTRTTGALP